MQLVLKDTQQPAIVGQTYISFRGEQHTLHAARKPHKVSSSGRVYTDKGEFFPSVLGMEWVEIKTVVAANSIGRDKVMDREEYMRRATTDHRIMCRTPEQYERAEELLRLQQELASDCFDTLWALQNGEDV